jgi:hypothetical protein
MALRALFFIAAVALLAPHESGFDAKGSPLACDSGACTFDASMLGKAEAQMFARLAEVKAEIAAAQAARARS